MAGGTRESVNKIFQNWHRWGLINLGKGSIMIHNVAAIERLSEKSARARKPFDRTDSRAAAPRRAGGGVGSPDDLICSIAG